MNRFADIAIKIVLPIAILVAAGVLTAQLIMSREAPSRTEAEQQAAVVETQVVHQKAHRLDVHASGTVEPARQVRVQPEVSGRVVNVHENLEPGGLVQEGETLIQIDRSDYRLAVQQRKTALDQAKSQLALEKGQQEVAKREWKLFQKEAEKLAEDADPSLALRKPQLANARAQVEAAQSQLEQARLNLQRTTVEAPFDALIRDESVSVGDLAGTQSPVATLVATDAFWVRLKVAPAKISHIDIPEVNAEKGSKAEIRYDTGETTVEREGRVRRLVGGLDRAGRLARIIVEIRDPLGLEGSSDKESFRGIPLLLDSYVDATIEGGAKRELIELPRSALRDGDQVYVYDDGTLDIRTVEIAWRRPESVLVGSGLEDGDRVVVGPMPNPLEGMKLERASDADEASPNEDATDGDSSEETGTAEAEQEAATDAGESAE